MALVYVLPCTPRDACTRLGLIIRIDDDTDARQTHNLNTQCMGSACTCPGLCPGLGRPSRIKGFAHIGMGHCRGLAPSKCTHVLQTGRFKGAERGLSRPGYVYAHLRCAMTLTLCYWIQQQASCYSAKAGRAGSALNGMHIRGMAKV